MPRSQSARDEDGSSPSLREQFERASVPARALLPLRFFFGATFLFAGIDKLLLDPAFFDASSPASIVAQLAAFARVSPLAPLVRIAEPFAIPLGLLIALAEIAIGLGALTGLAYRTAAIGGALLSFMFWLTASWTTHPFYYGPDLPYAFGWLALALAGDGGLFVPRVVREIGTPEEDDWPGALRGPFAQPDEPSPLRRQMLQAAVLGAAAFAVASVSVPLRFVRGSDANARTAGADGQPLDASGAGSGAAPTGAAGSNAPTDAATNPPADPSSPAAPSAPPLTGLAIARISDVDKVGARRFRVPASAPASLPAGDPGVIVKLADGSYVAYDATCTHEGCRVGWDKTDNVLLCPCHGAAFDPSDHGAVLGGPTNQPLLELPIDVDHQAGTITLRA